MQADHAPSLSSHSAVTCPLGLSCSQIYHQITAFFDEDAIRCILSNAATSWTCMSCSRGMQPNCSCLRPGLHSPMAGAFPSAGESWAAQDSSSQLPKLMSASCCSSSSAVRQDLFLKNNDRQQPCSETQKADFSGRDHLPMSLYGGLHRQDIALQAFKPRQKACTRLGKICAVCKWIECCMKECIQAIHA